MPETNNYNQWFANALESLGCDTEEILEDIMMTHDLTPEEDFEGYIRQMNENGHAIVFEDEDDVWGWLLEYGHI